MGAYSDFLEAVKWKLGLLPPELMKAQGGEIRIVSFPAEDVWMGAVRTPLGLFTHKEGRARSSSQGEVYSSAERPPSHPLEWAGLRWGVNVMVSQVTGRVLPEFWSPPGRLRMSFWGKDFLVLDWERGNEEGERGYLDIWAPLFFCRLDQEVEPETWWQFYDLLNRNSGQRNGRVVEVPARQRELFSLAPLTVRERIAIKQVKLG